MEIEQATALIARNARSDVGKYYGISEGVALGKGCIYRSAPFPVFDDTSSLYETAEGIVLVLSHECDVDEENGRNVLSTDVLICPLIPLEDFVAEYSQILQDDAALGAFLSALAARDVSRAIYMPPIASDIPSGAVVYLNQITHTTVTELNKVANRIGTVSAFGLMEIEYSLEQHLLRPKADRLALSGALIG